jgi:hypothetical protein
MIGRTYLDPGDRTIGWRYDPPRPVTVLEKWGNRPKGQGGPRNVLVWYRDDGHLAVIPFPRRLRRMPGGGGPGGR